MNNKLHEIYSKHGLLLLFMVVIGLGGRIFPHVANVTPLLAIALFAGKEFSASLAMGVAIAIIMLSDIALGFVQGHSIWGGWTFFTYTGLMGVVCLGRSLLPQVTMSRLIPCTLGASVGFWVWTNFGTWILSGMYPHTFSGLLTCYELAIPFLRNSMLGDLIWVAVLFGTPVVLRNLATAQKISSI